MAGLKAASSFSTYTAHSLLGWDGREGHGGTHQTSNLRVCQGSREHRRSDGAPILHSLTTFLSEGGLVDPQLRASSEHSFIVRALRARRAAWLLSFLFLLRPRVARARGISGLPLFFLRFKQLVALPKDRVDGLGWAGIEAEPTAFKAARRVELERRG